MENNSYRASLMTSLYICIQVILLQEIYWITTQFKFLLLHFLLHTWLVAGLSTWTVKILQ